jgi:hypothetical protein
VSSVDDVGNAELTKDLLFPELPFTQKAYNEVSATSGFAGFVG